MLVIAVSHGYTSAKAYTQTFVLQRADISVPSLRNVLQFLEQRHSVETAQLDEVLVVENDKVLYHYTEKDIDDDYEEVDEEELEFVEKVA